VVDRSKLLAAARRLSNRELLQVWSEATPLAIFPRRKVGRLAEEYEASLVARVGDPPADFSNTGRIALRVKQGFGLP
jgi:hypothetical protein